MSNYPLANPNEEPICRGPKNEPPGPYSVHILVVDDESAIRNLLTKMLSAEGYLVDIATDGEEAWQATHVRRYDGFIADLKMPGLGGQEFWVRLKKRDKNLASRVIFMTGDTASHKSREFIPASGRPLIEKPFDLVEVRREVRRVLEAVAGGEQDK